MLLSLLCCRHYFAHASFLLRQKACLPSNYVQRGLEVFGGLRFFFCFLGGFFVVVLFFSIWNFMCIMSWKLFHFHSARGIGDADFSQESLIHSSISLTIECWQTKSKWERPGPCPDRLTLQQECPWQRFSCTLHNSGGTIQTIDDDHVSIHCNSVLAGDSKMS